MINVSDDFFQEVVDKFIFSVKKDLLYTEDDVWIKIEDGKGRVGVTDFLQRRGGDVTFVELPKKGTTVNRGKEIASFETIKAVIPIASPFDGVIDEVNSKLNDRPELINEDPYGEGWIASVSLAHPKEKSNLLTGEKYFELMKAKINEMRSKRAT